MYCCALNAWLKGHRDLTSRATFGEQQGEDIGGIILILRKKGNYVLYMYLYGYISVCIYIQMSLAHTDATFPYYLLPAFWYLKGLQEGWRGAFHKGV